MVTLLAAAWLCLPLAPLNPVEEDTLSLLNLHVTLGAYSPGHFVSSGPEIAVKFEKLLLHPLVLSTSLEYSYGRSNGRRWFDAAVHQGTLSLTAVYYRGTDRLTGYLGIGPVLKFGHVGLSRQASDSLAYNHGITDVDLKAAPGYRLVFGLRYLKTYSLEIGITEVVTDIQYTERQGPDRWATTRDEADLGAVKISLGYLWPLKD